MVESAKVLKKIAKIDHFRHFNDFFSTQNINVARFARNVEWQA